MADVGRVNAGPFTVFETEAISVCPSLTTTRATHAVVQDLAHPRQDPAGLVSDAGTVKGLGRGDGPLKPPRLNLRAVRPSMTAGGPKTKKKMRVLCAYPGRHTVTGTRLTARFGVVVEWWSVEW